MWIVLCFDRLNDTQMNLAVLDNDETLLNYSNKLLSELEDASIVMIPTNQHKIHKKIYPLITSKHCDIYVQWFELNQIPN